VRAIGKKQKNVTRSDDKRLVGDVWTYIALDVQTKLIPSYIVGKRDHYHTHAFMYDLAARIKNRVQLSSDSLALYASAFERGFGIGVDHAQIVKTYASDERYPQGKYSARMVLYFGICSALTRLGSLWRWRSVFVCGSCQLLCLSCAAGNMVFGVAG
jgi:IS1 family transposase